MTSVWSTAIPSSRDFAVHTVGAVIRPRRAAFAILFESCTTCAAIDWIAQAQLCVLFDDQKVQSMRVRGVRDVFSFVETVNDSQSPKELSQLIDVSESVLSRSVIALIACPAYRHLEELKASL
jgi:hypothetical protein